MFGTKFSIFCSPHPYGCRMRRSKLLMAEPRRSPKRTLQLIRHSTGMELRTKLQIMPDWRTSCDRRTYRLQKLRSAPIRGRCHQECPIRVFD
ncbi:unnamed protein product [Nesidiocoris tenuis]|uniref:Uncharacterized protein n=1 Tax=Nesidiocoris tenuis TaxID=355587 RepID=A0A6H5HHJ8_9HEMI|nr:unnamed protein product [Nesidiocoris tenuis]